MMTFTLPDNSSDDVDVLVTAINLCDLESEPAPITIPGIHIYYIIIMAITVTFSVHIRESVDSLCMYIGMGRTHHVIHFESLQTHKL